MLYKIPFLLISVTAFLLGSYDWLLLSFSIFLLINGITANKFNEKVFSYFFLGYLTIPFLNISEYRGTISTDTLGIYCSVQLLFLSLLSVFEKEAKYKDRLPEYRRTAITEVFFLIHMAILYAAVAYVYATIGPIIVRQDLRFNIPPTIEYIIKSGLALPLFWVYFDRGRIGTRSIIFKYLLPITPSLLIGSRGTFIIILAAIFASLHLFREFGPESLRARFQKYYTHSRKIAISALLLAIAAIYTGFYIRRDGNDLITATDALDEYSFSSKGIAVRAILPLYMGLRETVGLTNRIISDDIQNPTDIPLFYSELLTFLPGHQIAPGNVLAIDIYRAQGSDEKYSLTPGIVGGVFLDYRYYFYPIIGIFSIALALLFNAGTRSLRWRLIYVISLVQFFHLYHRGFMKLEYLVPYIILIAYTLTLSKSKPHKTRPSNDVKISNNFASQK